MCPGPCAASRRAVRQRCLLEHMQWISARLIETGDVRRYPRAAALVGAAWRARSVPVSLAVRFAAEQDHTLGSYWTRMHRRLLARRPPSARWQLARAFARWRASAVRGRRPRPAAVARGAPGGRPGSSGHRPSGHRVRRGDGALASSARSPTVLPVATAPPASARCRRGDCLLASPATVDGFAHALHAWLAVTARRGTPAHADPRRCSSTRAPCRSRAPPASSSRGPAPTPRSARCRRWPRSARGSSRSSRRGAVDEPQLVLVAWMLETLMGRPPRRPLLAPEEEELRAALVARLGADYGEALLAQMRHDAPTRRLLPPALRRGAAHVAAPLHRAPPRAGTAAPRAPDGRRRRRHGAAARARAAAPVRSLCAARRRAARRHAHARAGRRAPMGRAVVRPRHLRARARAAWCSSRARRGGRSPSRWSSARTVSRRRRPTTAAVADRAARAPPGAGRRPSRCGPRRPRGTG